MALGPGKYDDLCTYVRVESGAVMALVIVVGGNRGDGFSVQVLAPPSEAPGYSGNAIEFDQVGAMLAHAAVLRDVANALQADARRLMQKKRGD